MIRILAAAAALVLVGPSAAAQDDLPALALSLVNEARSEAGLPSLSQSVTLVTAAREHARDMAERDYYAHVTPEGQTAHDRYVAAGGSRWRLVAENIARCSGCETPIDAERVRAFQSGWMQSPGHRQNILTEGLDAFGFGVASDGSTAYAVQVFAGPGTPEGEAADAPRAAAEEVRGAALDAVNAARKEQGLAALELSEELNALAEALAKRASFEGGRLELPSDPISLLPEGSGSWAAIATAAEACGGCGGYPTASGAADFARRLAESGGEDSTHLGFALEADGSGRKVAVASFGRR